MTDQEKAQRLGDERKLVLVERCHVEALVKHEVEDREALQAQYELRAVLAAPADPIRWGAPRTVRDLMRQMATLDPDLEVFAMHRMPADFRDGRQVAAVHLSSSYERVKGRFLSDYKGDGRKVIAFWCKADERQADTLEPFTVQLPGFDGYKDNVVRELQAAFTQAIEAAGGQVTPNE